MSLETGGDEMADQPESMFTDGFAEAMKRVGAQRLGHVLEKKKLLQRSALNVPGHPNTTFSIFNFLGWLHVKAAQP
jgi:hypothetical protein